LFVQCLEGHRNDLGRGAKTASCSDTRRGTVKEKSLKADSLTWGGGGGKNGTKKVI